MRTLAWRTLARHLTPVLACAFAGCERPASPAAPAADPVAAATTARPALLPYLPTAHTDIVVTLGTTAPAGSPAAPSPTGAGTTAAPATPPAPAAPAAPPAIPATAILRGAVAVEPGARLPLAAGAETVVDPAAGFEVELSARSSDARLVLVDGRDDLVAASETREVSAAGTRLTLVPAAPLVPASKYLLRVDGASGRELHDEAGRAYAPVSFALLAAGTAPPPEPKQPARGAKKRRRDR